MTHDKPSLGPKIALYEPDIPQNTASIVRTCSCLGAQLEIIEPCGFLFTDKRFKRVVMDYLEEDKIKFYKNAEDFFNTKRNQRVILITTKVHKIANEKLKIPMAKNKRSLNLATSVGIVLAEQIRQIKN
jgi:tRNA (cytidine/uridine-2'-O-)-methyltransferase